MASSAASRSLNPDVPVSALSAQRQFNLRMLLRFIKAHPFSLHFLLGLLLVIGLLGMALLGPALAPYPYDLIRTDARLLAPSAAHPFGTDAFGRDLLSRILVGARIAVGVSLTAALISALPGISLGLLAGYRRGWLDQVLSRFIDAWLSLPGLLLAVVIIARMGPSLASTVIAMGVTGVPAYYRMTRSATLHISQTAFVEAERAVGASDGRIMLRHILPNISSPLMVLTSLRMGIVLLAVGGLSFIGLGAQPPAPEWGALLAGSRDYFQTAWWLMFFPGLAITCSVVGFNLLGDGLRDMLALESRHHRVDR
jgi:ABC-type dipeptide/oligopeptide/nickel transport system permease subunit